MLEPSVMPDAPAVTMPPRRIGPRHDGATRIIAIIGAGFSGTMAAIHLRHQLPADYVVYLFDRSGRFARGPAYAASETPHLLNVRSMNMSAFPSDPTHFERWMSGQAERMPAEITTTDAGTFATRRLYGRYLRALLYEEMTASGGRVRLGGHDVTSLRREAGGWRLTCGNGRELLAAGVVLAAGNLPSSQPCDGIVFHDPWADRATADLRADEPVLIVGTGLTMADVALGMHANGFRGPIVALSRRGLVPQRHRPAGSPWPAPDFSAEERRSLSALLRRLRGEIRKAADQGTDWRAVIDGLRPITAELWRGLPPDERDRFLRYLRPYWDVHRHRMAPNVADGFDALVSDGRLRLLRGRVREIERHGDRACVTIQDRGTTRRERLDVQRVIYAIGSGSAVPGEGLIGSLIETGQGRTDPHGMGLEVTERLAVIDGNGTPAERLWALGPIVRGVFWECTAVPDIRVQARIIADEVNTAVSAYTAKSTEVFGSS